VQPLGSVPDRVAFWHGSSLPKTGECSGMRQVIMSITRRVA
jgi:hypothetical protein